MCVTVVARCRYNLNELDYEGTLRSRKFTRWYKRNKKTINTLVLTAPAFAFTLFHMDAQVFEYLRKDATMYVLAANEYYTPPPTNQGDLIPVNGTGVGQSFFQTHGVILLHMLIMGFLTLVVTTFLKFTGRGDLIPLIAFVGGGAILYEVLGLFMDIYQAILKFLSL